MAVKEIPNPGSNEAVELGCTCPVLDNDHGLGIGGDGDEHGWWMTRGSPVHDLGEEG